MRRRSTASTACLPESWRGWRRSKQLSRHRARVRPRTAGLKSKGYESRDLDGDTHEVLHLDSVAWLEILGDRLRADARHVHLSLRIVEVGEADVPRHLAVDADRLHS